ncbi:MAG TPA: DUF3570 domain-containing protein [Steroidobacteraceae bacterium]|jgi:hypothetical protein|nr:DUF3570 domain-containing protein [Steroidobacteraceae bacterium]
MRISPRHLCRLAAVATLSMMCVAGAAVLPDDRADLFWSTYRGGGMDITGESVLVRKKFSENFAMEANYFVDKVSGASIDVLSQASVIKDERKQKTLSLDYIHDKTQYNLSYTDSTERDYISNTTHFSLSQDMFGDLTTVTLGFTDSRNKVGENNGGTNTPKIEWLGHATSRSYEGGLSQILTKNLIAGATVEIITDQGLLSNPYRSIRYRVDPSINPLGYALGSQVYPNTHTSTAGEVRAKYYLPYRAAASVSYRYFSDTWGIRANTIELGYTQPVSNKWIFEGRLRHYNQNSATFYSDLFPFANSQNFEARDQNLAASTNNTIDGKVTWAFAPSGFLIFKRATASFDVTRIQFKYGDFRNIKDFNVTPAGGGYQPGTEPLYAFDAMVYQVYISMFF